MKETIIFKKERELGEILSDTFKFLRLEGKELFGYIFRIAGPALVIMVIAMSVYTRSALGGFGSTDLFPTSTNFTGGLLISLFLLVVSGLAYYALLYGVINHYIKSYIKNEGTVLKEDVTQGVKSDFWSLIGLNLISGVIIVIGLFICGFPGIYLSVALICTYSIFIIDRLDISNTIRYSFKLIKGEWWMTFATLIVMGILYYIMIIVFQIPQYIYFFIKSFVFSETVSIDPSVMTDWGYTIFSAIGMIGQYLGYTLLAITTVFIYYNLNEKKNLTGTIEQIDNLGEDKDDTLITRF
jgi:hypothetical protein